MNKQKIHILLTVVILTGALFAVPQIYAQSPGTSPRMNFFQEFIQFIAQKFGLDKTQVQTAVTDFQKQRKATVTPRPALTSQQMADKEKTRLDQLVKDGKITADQETAIINELPALKTKYNFGSLKDLTPDQRKTQRETMRSEIVSWAQSQGVDSSYVMPGFGMGMGGKGMIGRGKGWDFGERGENVSPAPTQ